MGIQNQDFDYSDFNFLKNQSKRVLYGVQSKPRGQSQRGSANYTTKNQSNTTMTAYNGQGRKYSKGNNQSYAKSTNTFTKEERYSVNMTQQSYGKAMGAKNALNKALKTAYASTASDSDSNNGCNQSELYGFKIVQNARTIHDEIEEDVDLFESDNDNEWPMMGSTSNEKFAASELTIGPNAKEISLPSFA